MPAKVLDALQGYAAVGDLAERQEALAEMGTGALMQTGRLGMF